MSDDLSDTLPTAKLGDTLKVPALEGKVVGVSTFINQPHLDRVTIRLDSGRRIDIMGLA